MINLKNSLFCPFIFFITIHLCLLSFPAWGEIVDGVVAIVNDEVITLSEVIRIAQLQSSNADSSQYREVLERLVDQKLIDQATKGMEIKVSEQDIDDLIKNFEEANRITDSQLKDSVQQKGVTWEEYRQELREGIRRNRVISQVIRSESNISEKEIKDYFQEHSDQYFKPSLVKIEKMFFPVSEETSPVEKNRFSQKAQRALERIKSGEDFQKVAQELNLPEDTSSCDVGFFKKGELMDTLDQEAFSLKPGEVSNVISTKKGYCIIRVLERTEEKTKKLEEVREEIESHLFQQKMEEKFQEWLKKLRNNAYIDIKL